MPASVLLVGHVVHVWPRLLVVHMVHRLSHRRVVLEARRRQGARQRCRRLGRLLREWRECRLLGSGGQQVLGGRLGRLLHRLGLGLRRLVGPAPLARPHWLVGLGVLKVLPGLGVLMVGLLLGLAPRPGLLLLLLAIAGVVGHAPVLLIRHMGCIAVGIHRSGFDRSRCWPSRGACESSRTSASGNAEKGCEGHSGAT